MGDQRQPLFSIVLPAYDPGPHLRTALRDVLAQTVGDWECIVVDDGGREDLSWVDDFDPRIRRVRQANAGVSAARNLGVAQARASLVAFLDQDDRWHADRLAGAVDMVQAHPDAAFWGSRFTWVLPDRTQRGDFPEQASLPWFLRSGVGCPSAVTVRRADYVALGGQDPDLAMCQDLEFLFRLLRHRQQPAAIHRDELVRYVVHGDNASMDYWRTDIEVRRVYRTERRHARGSGCEQLRSAVWDGQRERRKTHAFQAIDAARVAWGQRETREVARHLARGFLCSPAVLASEALGHLKRIVRPLSPREAAGRLRRLDPARSGRRSGCGPAADPAGDP